MAQIPDPLTLLGKPSDSPEVQDLLHQGGAKSPKLKKGDTNAWVDLNKLGLALVFVDEAFFTKRKDIAIGEGALLLNSITFHSGADTAFSVYASPLPQGVRFDQTQAELAAKLGKPEESDADLCLDRWQIDGVWYFATYSDAFDRLLNFSIQVPDPPKPSSSQSRRSRP